MPTKTIKTRGKDKGPVTAPFVVQVDTREQKPYVFSGLRTDAKDGDRLINVPIHFESLADGDYSIVGFAGRLGIERKSKDDLFGSVARRANFEARLRRMTDRRLMLGWDKSYFAVVVESELKDLLQEPPRFSKLHPRSLNRTIMAWRQRYAVDWWFVAGRARAEAYTFRLLERFWKDHSED